VSVTIGSNIAARRALRQLDQATGAVTRVSERLSSGQRINRASDDAAGLAIVTGLQSNARVFAQGIRNLNDGISAVSIADSALGNLSGVATRILELSQQSANGTFSRLQRLSLDDEADELVSEFNRVLQTTRFNGLNLLNRDLAELRIQAGFGVDGSIGFSLNRSLSRAVGTGSFSETSLAGGNNGLSAAGDFDGDGIQDLMVVLGTSDGLRFLKGNGDGTFQAAATQVVVGARSSTGEMRTADLDGDGQLDLIFSGSTGGGVAIAWGRGGGLFDASVTNIGSGVRSKVDIGDLDGDGDLDLVGVNTGGSTIGINNGGRSFTASNPGGLGSDVNLADLNGDGRSEIVVGSLGVGSGARIYTYAAEGLVLRQTLSSSNSGQVAVGDFDGDGQIDIVESEGTTVRSFRNQGGFSFQQVSTVTSSFTPAGLELIDLDGDGRLDLWLRSTNQFSVSTGNGDGSFSAALVTSSLAIGNRDESFLDANGDGVLDAIIVGSNGVNQQLQSTALTTTIAEVNLTTAANAREAITTMTELIARLARERGELGASQSRFEVALNVLASTRENSLAASSRISDADVAGESSNLVRQQILQQIGASVLAQANQLPSLALALLR
jgi:flagellin